MNIVSRGKLIPSQQNKCRLLFLNSASIHQQLLSSASSSQPGSLTPSLAIFCHLTSTATQIISPTPMEAVRNRRNVLCDLVGPLLLKYWTGFDGTCQEFLEQCPPGFCDSLPHGSCLCPCLLTFFCGFPLSLLDSCPNVRALWVQFLGSACLRLRTSSSRMPGVSAVTPGGAGSLCPAPSRSSIVSCRCVPPGACGTSPFEYSKVSGHFRVSVLKTEHLTSSP